MSGGRGVRMKFPEIDERHNDYFIWAHSEDAQWHLDLTYVTGSR